MRSRRAVTPLTGAAVAWALVACSHAGTATLPAGTVRFVSAAGTNTLRVQIADTEPARQAGLMHRTRLAPGSGMAFVFAAPSTRSFWMKDTVIPLSAAFWSKGGRIVAVLDMTPCRRDPCPLYSPGVRYVGAVEANLGWFGARGISVGDSVSLVRDP
jgi:uncharacterized protein